MEQRVIDGIVKASGVQAGELILIHFWGETEDLPIAHGFMEAVAALGASPMLLHQARTVNQRLFAKAADGSFDDKYFSLFTGLDAVLDVFAYRPIVLGATLPDPQQAQYRRYIATLFRQLVQCKRFAQLRMPTAANAEESGLDPAEYIRRMNAAYSVDYEQLLHSCQQEADRLSRSPRLTLHTGEDCSLRFDLTGRAWHIDAGDGDWPCGEVYIAPVESATEGSVYFPELHVEDAGCFPDVTLDIREGRVVRSSSEALNAFLDALPPEGRVVAELGLGMNPGVDSLCGCTVLDEKMAGTFHIALGANTMFGGQNDAPLHMDLVGRGQWRIKEENDDD